MPRTPKIEMSTRSAAAVAAKGASVTLKMKGNASPPRRGLSAMEKKVLKTFERLPIEAVTVDDLPMELDQMVAFVPTIKLHDLAVGGMPTRMLSGYVATMHLLKESDVLNAIGVSGRTIQRRQDAKLAPEPSAAAIDFATILNRATEVLGDRDLAEQWMKEPALGLDGRKPIDLLSSRLGATLVKDHLTRMDYGVYA